MFLRILSLILIPCTLHAELLSESEVIERLQSLMKGAGDDADSSDSFPVDRLEALHGKSASVDEWLELLELWVASSSTSAADYRIAQQRITWLNQLFNVLPPSAEWPEIREKLPNIAGADEEGKNLLSALATALSGDLEAIADVAATFTPEPNSWQNPQDNLLLFVSTVTDDPKLISQSINTRLASTSAEGRAGDRPRFEVPALAAKLPGPEAMALLAEVLKNGSIKIHVEDSATHDLAIQAALANLDELPVAPWELTSRGKDAPKLFAALTGKFGEPFAEREFVNAFLGEVRRKIERGELDEALEAFDHVVKNAPADAEPTQRLWGYYGIGSDPAKQEHYYNFCKLLAGREAAPSDSSFWSVFMGVAMRTDMSTEAIDLFEKRVANPQLDDAVKEELQTALMSAWLADQQLDKAIPALKERLALQLRRPGSDESPFSLMKTLWEIGRLTGDEKLVEEMQQKVLGIAEKFPALLSWSYTEFVEEFVEAGKFQDAQRMVFASVQGQATQGYGAPSSMAEQLTALAWIADRAGNAKSNWTLFEKASWWGADDLASLGRNTAPDGTPLLVLAARAAAAAGDNATARPLAEAAVRQHRGNDRAYEGLLEIFGDAAVPILEQLAVEDPFEERPLIWHAALLLKGGDAAGAEALAKRAIAIDPSDGEQGKGDRMRAYAVLADALDAAGHTEDATLYRRAVDAIRLAETADEFRESGMLKKSIELSKESLKIFADAYCIQSRLALDLVAVGRMEEAEVHYQRAYELMPDSFGRVESHCFGCEGVFTGVVAESIAERTFKKLLEASPDKPQLHYLLGYLYSDMGRHKDAARHLAEATRLDPDYLNAWIKYGGQANAAGLSGEERNRIAQNTVRLAPLGGIPMGGSFSDPGKFSDALHEGLARYGTRIPSDGLLALPASKAMRESLPDGMLETHAEMPAPFGSSEVLVAEHEALRPIIRLLAEHSWMTEE